MDFIYKRFENLMESRGITQIQVARNAKIPQATLSDWKQGKYTPKADKLQKIADYFDVSLDWLMYGRDAEHYSVSDEEKDYLEEFRNRREIKILFKSAKTANKEQLEVVTKALDLMKGNADGEQ